MHEYALIQDGEIVNVVTTSKPLWEVALAHADVEVKPLHMVSLSVLQRYEYWAERP